MITSTEKNVFPFYEQHGPNENYAKKIKIRLYAEA